MAGGESVNAWLIVIHKIGKALNLCIIKTATSTAPAEHPLKTRLFWHPQNHLQIGVRFQWLPFQEVPQGLTTATPSPSKSLVLRVTMVNP